MDIHYTTNTAGVNSVVEHLARCETHFMPPLLPRIKSFEDYAEKIVSKAQRFEAWDDDQLIGLVAVYMNDESKENTFVTNWSVVNEYVGKGIATKLVGQSIQVAKSMGFRRMVLEVSTDNHGAIAVYKKMEFVEEQIVGHKLTMTRFL